jgi:hypothetical protein
MADEFLTRMITSIRRGVDEPATNSKYTDAILIDEIEKAFPVILDEINRNKQDDMIVARFNVTVVAGTETYILPTLISSVVSLYTEDAVTKTRSFYFSRGRRNTAGRGVYLEGNMLKVQPNAVTAGTVIVVEYIPAGTARLHYGACTLNATGDIATFGASPVLGALDTHANAYAGCIFRILSAATTNSFIQERIITSYDNTTRAATLAAPLSPIPTGALVYEIAPPILRGLDDVIAIFIAWQIALTEGQRTRANDLQRVYLNRIRTVRLSAFYYNQTTTPTMRVDGANNSRRFMRRL